METPVLVLRLANLQNSTFYKEGTEKNPVYVNAPGLRRIPNTSNMKDPTGRSKSYIKIRYIAGCDEIRVTEQDKALIKPNPLEDQIFFKNGDLIVHNEGSEVGLYNYLKACEWNKSNENRPKHATAIFEELRVEEKSEQVIKSVRARTEALSMIQSLTSEDADGKLVYEEDTIRSLGRIFGYSGLSIPEQVERLYERAITEPETLVATIADQKNVMRVDVAQGLELAIINVEGPMAAFASGGTIMKFKSKDPVQRKEELVKFFLSQDGEEAYTEMKSQILVRREEMVATM